MIIDCTMRLRNASLRRARPRPYAAALIGARSATWTVTPVMASNVASRSIVCNSTSGASGGWRLVSASAGNGVGMAVDGTHS